MKIAKGSEAASSRESCGGETAPQIASLPADVDSLGRRRGRLSVAWPELPCTVAHDIGLLRSGRKSMLNGDVVSKEFT